MLITGLDLITKVLRDNAGARQPMARWIQLATEAEWNDIIEARATFPTADSIKGTGLTCFNVAGNRYRLITIVGYRQQTVSIVELLTHEEYDRKYR